MDIKKLFTAVVLSAGILTSLTSSAFEGDRGGERGGKGRQGGHHMKKGGFMMKKLLGKLDLTEEQKEQLEVLKSEGDREVFAEQMKAAREKLHNALRNESGVIDEGIVRETSAEIAELTIQQAYMMQDKKAAFEDILTDEQKTQLETLKLEMKEKFQSRKDGSQGKKRGKGRQAKGRKGCANCQENENN